MSESSTDIHLYSDMTLLCVDDDKIVLQTLQRLFHRKPYKIIIADSAQKALKIIENTPIDVIVSDMRMPEMDGAMLLEKVANLHADIYRIVLSGYADFESTIAAINLGKIHRFINKPWGNKDLVNAVEEGFECSRLKKENNEKTLKLNELNEKLMQLSRIDGLTGLANRRYMDEFIDREWLRAIRNKLPITFLLIDIDFFKAYNDNYGHLQGDECLKTVAIALKKLANRPGDLAARYGGEEFALIFPETSEAQYIAKKCLTAIQSLALPHGFSEAAEIVTISIGYHSLQPAKGSIPEDIIALADKALYQAKDLGRNRFEGA